MALDHDIDDARERICELCRLFYDQGWVSGTGGGISIRVRAEDGGDRVVMAPSGVQKERLQPGDLYVLDMDAYVVREPDAISEGVKPKLSACAPLFFNAFALRDAGAVLHSHSVDALLATLAYEDEFVVTEIEMIKGIAGHGYHDRLVVPIIENTAHESDLAESMAAAIEAYPKSYAVLVRRHGVYVWGKDWQEAKRHAECYDYLFGAAVKMKQLGFDPTRPHEAH